MHAKNCEVINDLKTFINHDNFFCTKDDDQQSYNRAVPLKNILNKHPRDTNGFSKSKKIEIDCKINTFKGKHPGQIRSIIDMNCDKLPKSHKNKKVQNCFKNLQLNCQLSENSLLNFPSPLIRHFPRRSKENHCRNYVKELEFCKKFSNDKKNIDGSDSISTTDLQNDYSCSSCSNTDDDDDDSSVKNNVAGIRKCEPKKSGKFNSPHKKRNKNVRETDKTSKNVSSENQKTSTSKERKKSKHGEKIQIPPVPVDQSCQTSSNDVKNERTNKFSVSMDEVIDRCMMKQQKLNMAQKNFKCNKLLHLKNLQRKSHDSPFHSNKFAYPMESQNFLDEPPLMQDSENEIAGQILRTCSTLSEAFEKSIPNDKLRQRRQEHASLSRRKSNQPPSRKHSKSGRISTKESHNVSSLNDLIFCFYMLFSTICNFLIKLLTLFTQNLFAKYSKKPNQTAKISKHEKKSDLKQKQKKSTDKHYVKHSGTTRSKSLSDALDKSRKNSKETADNGSEFEKRSEMSNSATNQVAIDCLCKVMYKCCNKINENKLKKIKSDATKKLSSSPKAREEKVSSFHTLKENKEDVEEEQPQLTEIVSDSVPQKKQAEQQTCEKALVQIDCKQVQECVNERSQFQLAQQLELQNQLQQLTMMQINNLLKLTSVSADKSSTGQPESSAVVDQKKLENLKPETSETKFKSKDEKIYEAQKEADQIVKEKESLSVYTMTNDREQKVQEDEFEKKNTVQSEGENDQKSELRLQSKKASNTASSFDVIFEEIKHSLQDRILSQQIFPYVPKPKNGEDEAEFENARNKLSEGDRKDSRRSGKSNRVIFEKEPIDDKLASSRSGNSISFHSMEPANESGGKNISEVVPSSTKAEDQSFYQALISTPKGSKTESFKEEFADAKETVRSTSKTKESFKSLSSRYSAKSAPSKKISTNAQPSEIEEPAKLPSERRSTVISEKSSEKMDESSKLPDDQNIALISDKVPSSENNLKNLKTSEQSPRGSQISLKKQSSNVVSIGKKSSFKRESGRALTPVPEIDAENQIDDLAHENLDKNKEAETVHDSKEEEGENDIKEYEKKEEEEEEEEENGDDGYEEENDKPMEDIPMYYNEQEIFFGNNDSIEITIPKTLIKTESKRTSASEAKTDAPKTSADSNYPEKKISGRQESSQRNSIRSLTDYMNYVDDVVKHKESDRQSRSRVSKTSFDAKSYRTLVSLNADKAANDVAKKDETLKNVSLPNNEANERKETFTIIRSKKGSKNKNEKGNKINKPSYDENKSVGSISLDAYFLKLQTKSEMEFKNLRRHTLHDIESAKIENFDEKTTKAFREAIAQGALTRNFEDNKNPSRKT